MVEERANLSRAVSLAGRPLGLNEVDNIRHDNVGRKSFLCDHPALKSGKRQALCRVGSRGHMNRLCSLGSPGLMRKSPPGQILAGTVHSRIANFICAHRELSPIQGVTIH